MKPDTTIKEELIIEAALNRFIHFGFNKTTFSEIARDLNITQQSIYYYFPDKKSLITKVAENIMASFLEELLVKISQTKGLVEKLKGIVDVKASFFEKYFMLAIDHPKENLRDSDELHRFYLEMEDKQLAIVVSEFNEAIERGELKKTDADKTASILLKALSSMQFDYKQQHMIPDHNSLRELFDNQKELITIFISGLQNHATPCSN